MSPQPLDVGERSRDGTDAGVEVGAVPGRPHGGLSEIRVPSRGRDANEFDLVGDVERKPREQLETLCVARDVELTSRLRLVAVRAGQQR